MRIGLLIILIIGLATSPDPPSSPAVIRTTPQSVVADAGFDQADGGVKDTIDAYPPAEKALLTALYAPGDFQRLWIDADGQLNRDAREALEMLAAAREEALEPDDYRAVELAARANDLVRSRSSAGVASYDVEFSGNLLRYFAHLRRGRIEPGSLGIRLIPRSGDVSQIVRQAREDHQIRAHAEVARPPVGQYAPLRTALAHYRSLAAAEVGEPLVFAGAVHPGDRYAGLSKLAHRLMVLGDLASDAANPPPEIFDGPVVSAVKRFQVRHGLEPDGVLGARTQAALNVPLTRRVEQIELALERLRWWPETDGERLLLINVPMFTLWAWDDPRRDAAPALTTAVIVGRAANTRTPVLVEDMREVIFRPFWNVPPSILRHEILPLLIRRPDYLREQNMEIVQGETDDALQVEATSENLAQLSRGLLRLRQQPGPANALGLVKFVFPNEENVYLHSTPAKQLFNRSRRDFSHGCVRVQDATGLAEWVLQGQSGWDRERILEAMNGETSRHVRLAHPVRVFLSYTTAAIDPDDGTVRFADDIYSQDTRLAEALRRARRGGWEER